MADQSSLDIVYLRMAYEWAVLSKAIRKKVGCLIVKNGSIISDGFNGMPAGLSNECEVWLNGRWETKPEVLHAESNAIAKLARSTQSSEGATMYLTCAPCIECAKLIIQAGIKRVVFHEIYRSIEGLMLLNSKNICTQRVKKIR